MGDYGIKIAEAGVDVKTAGLNQLIFHSSYPLFKIKSSGSGSVTPTIDGADHTYDIYTHNLGYKCMFDFFIQFYDPSSGAKQSTYKRVTISDGLAGGFDNLYTAFSDTTKLKLTLNLAVGDGTALSYVYYVYYDPIT